MCLNSAKVCMRLSKIFLEIFHYLNFLVYRYINRRCSLKTKALAKNILKAILNEEISFTAAYLQFSLHHSMTIFFSSLCFTSLHVLVIWIFQERLYYYRLSVSIISVECRCCILNMSFNLIRLNDMFI